MKKIKETLNEIFVGTVQDLKNATPDNRDKEILRMAIIAELDASNLYEQMSEIAIHPAVKKLLLDISKEEKVHVGEFEFLLERLDPEHEESEEEGKEEAEELTSDLWG